MRVLRLLGLLLPLALAPGCVVAGGVTPVHGYGYGYGYGYAPRPHVYAPRYYAPPRAYYAPPRPHWRGPPRWHRPHGQWGGQWGGHWGGRPYGHHRRW